MAGIDVSEHPTRRRHGDSETQTETLSAAVAWTAALVLLVAIGASAEARAQASTKSVSGTPSIVVDGTDWMASNADARRAFLIGVANLTLADIEARITRWYEANPAKMSMAVMGVVWQNLVGQRP